MNIFRDTSTALPERRLRALLIPVTALLLLACTWGGTYGAVRAHWREARSHLAADLAGQALSLEARLQGELRATSQTLRMLAAAIGRDPAGFDLAAWQHATTGAQAAARAILVTDAAGLVRASTRPGLLGIDVAAQDYFRTAQRRGTKDRRLVTGALQHGALPWEWRLTLARRLEHPDGSFAGIVAASVETDSLSGGDPGFDPGAGGVVALMTAADARLHPLAGDPDRGADVSLAGSTLAAAIAASPAGVWTGALPSDGIRRTVAFRHVPDSDLVVLTGVDPAEALRKAVAWETQAWEFAAAASLILALASALLLWLNMRTDRRAAALAQDHAALGARMTQLEATLAGMGDGIMMVDAELRLLEWNASFPELTGVPRDILHVGMAMEDMIRAQARGGEFGAVDIATEVKRRMASLRSGGSTGMIQRLRPDGRVLELRRNPLPGGGFVTLYTDVTARHAMEQRLQQAQKMAAVGRLTAGVAHDFNNLLATIVGSAELLERQVGGDSALARRLELIMQAAGRGSDLVRQLLAFARQQPLEPVLVDLNQILDGMTALLRATVGSRVRVETQARDRAVASTGRSGADRACRSQPGDQRPRRNGGWRRTEHHHRECHPDRAAPRDGPRTGRIRHGRTDRHRHRHDRGRAAQGVRAVLHHQGSGPRIGPGAEPGVWRGQPVRRRGGDRQPVRSGNHRHGVPAARRGRGGARPGPRQPAQQRRPATRAAGTVEAHPAGAMIRHAATFAASRNLVSTRGLGDPRSCA